jgi:flagellar basal-body rod protein FlgB
MIRIAQCQERSITALKLSTPRPMQGPSNGWLASSRRIGPLLPEVCPVLDDIASVSLQAAVAGLSTRQQVTANNIANLETPGFTASTVTFESSLADAVAAGDPGKAHVAVDASPAVAGVNGNNVSLDTEIVTATKTGLQERLLTGALTSKFGLINTVLKG